MDNFQGIDPKYLALIQAGMGILAANTGRQPAGAAIGTGLLGGTQGYQQALQQQQEQALRQQQMEMQKQEFDWKQKEYDQKLQQKSAEEKMNEQILQSLGIGTPPSQSPQDAPIDYNILNPVQPIPTQQPKGMDREAIYKLGVARSLTGGHGGDTLIKYADTMKPNWVNVGGKYVDSNKFQGEIPVSPAPMSEAERAQGEFSGWLKPQTPTIQPQSQPQSQQTTQPQVQPPAQKRTQPPAQQGYKYNPAISPKANQELAVKYESAKIDQQFKKEKPLPATVLKMQNEALDKLSIASNIDKDLAVVEKQVTNGQLNLGFFSNIESQIRNKAGYSTENSRNFGTFKNTLERLRNDSLRLNTGVQTDGDAQRAWNELFENINDNEFVKKRLGEIRLINQRGADLQKLQVDQIRSNFDAEPLDYSKYEGQKPAITSGSTAPAAAAMPAAKKDISKMPKSVITKIGGKSVTLKLGNDGLYYDDKGNGYSK